MKKSILVLSVLLLLLILTCVYQKAYVPFVNHNDDHPNTLTTMPPAPIHTVKKETTELKVKEKEIPRSITQTEVLDEPISKDKPSSVPVSKDNDIAKIDTLVQALKEREVALKNRDEFELHIQQLINQALEDRSAAIAHMNQEELRLIELQKELLKTRDIAYDKIGQTNIPRSGE